MRPCPACGQHIPDDHRFCGYCGARLVTEGAPTRSGEQREVTVMFVDVTNFTAASHAMASEQVFSWMSETMGILASIVDRYEGTIDKFTGDGLMALFGVPIAHEDDPERAVRAALMMHQALAPLRARLAEDRGVTFQVRIGLNTGPVVAGTIGGDRHAEYTVLGDTVNLAARLEKAADPGTVLVSTATYARTAPLFTYQAMAPIQVKGVVEPLQTYRPLGPAAQPGSLRGIAGLRAPLVGRDDDLARLRALVDAVCGDGRRRAALIAGAAGLGKSRLVAELMQAMVGCSIKMISCTCRSHTQGTPLWLAGELLRGLVGAHSGSPASPLLEAFAARHGLAGADLLPYLRHALGEEEPDSEAAAHLAALDPAMRQQQTRAAISQAFRAATGKAPLMIMCDDLHWVDPPSRDVLHFLVQTTEEAPLAFILVSRQPDHELVGEAAGPTGWLTELPLEGLSVGDGRALVDGLLGHPADEDDATAAILERAAGNPLYIEELLRMLIEQGGLALIEGRWAFLPHVRDLLGGVPASLRDLILARVDRLPPDRRSLLQLLAAVGRAAPEGLMTRLDGGNAAYTTARLQDLAARGFVVEDETDSYAFAYALAQDAVYNTMLRRDSEQLHTLIAEAILAEAPWSVEERTEALAEQYAASATPRLAIPYLVAAADVAEGRFAGATAAARYRQALSLMEVFPTGNGARAITARAGLGRALKAQGSLAEAGDVLAEALERLQVGGIAREGWAATAVEVLVGLADVRMREGALEEAAAHCESGLSLLGPDAPMAHGEAWRRLIYQLASVRLRQGQIDEVLRVAEPAAEGADAEGQPVILARINGIIGGALYEQDRLEEAATYVERSLGSYTSVGYTPGMAGAYANLGNLLFVRGRWGRAAESLEEALRLYRAIGYMPDQALTLVNLGLVRLARGDHDGAEEDLTRGQLLSARIGEEFGVVRAALGLTHLALLRGRMEEAEANLEEVFQRLDAVGEDEAVQARWLLARVRAQSGDVAAGIAQAEEALAQAKEAGLPEQETECMRVLGELRYLSDDFRGAEALLGAVVERCKRRGDSYQLAQALVSYGELCLRQAIGMPGAPERRVAQARMSLREAIDHLEHLGALYDLAHARELLAATEPLISA